MYAYSTNQAAVSRGTDAAWILANITMLTT